MIIGLSGKAGAGKDTVAGFLVWNHQFESIALADPMKKFCKEMFGFSREQLWGPSSARNAVDPRYGISPREALQKLGTEWGRACYENVWVDYAMKQAQFRLHSIACSGVVITDVRFKNEYDAIKKAGGRVWRIIRPSSGLEGAAAAHASENDLTDDMEYDKVIDNTGESLEALAKTVKDTIEGRR